MIGIKNVIGLNNVGKCREIEACFDKIKPALAILLEIRAKSTKTDIIRNKLGKNWMFADNYSKHDNGRIWIL